MTVSSRAKVGGNQFSKVKARIGSKMKPLGSKRKEVHHGFLPELHASETRRGPLLDPSYPLAKTEQPKAIGLEASREMDHIVEGCFGMVSGIRMM